MSLSLKENKPNFNTIANSKSSISIMKINTQNNRREIQKSKSIHSIKSVPRASFNERDKNLSELTKTSISPKNSSQDIESLVNVEVEQNYQNLSNKSRMITELQCNHSECKKAFDSISQYELGTHQKTSKSKEPSTEEIEKISDNLTCSNVDLEKEIRIKNWKIYWLKKKST
ncbi:unnamed protein product [Brachionus calyciflorus]|uniref:Uncharacterized protein n=1 Tax=Brachionus calyciflorus TaxID=104777 RepID=A0A813Y951_9BILA|nr:unnamed protein product [Brachionus calyciflorus]